MSAVDSELLNDIKVLDHLAELFERYLPIVVLVSLDNCAVHQLLQLHIIKVASNHHLQNSKELPVRDEAVVVNVINLESKTQFIFLCGSS